MEGDGEAGENTWLLYGDELTGGEGKFLVDGMTLYLFEVLKREEAGLW